MNQIVLIQMKEHKSKPNKTSKNRKLRKKSKKTITFSSRITEPLTTNLKITCRKCISKKKNFENYNLISTDKILEKPQKTFENSAKTENVNLFF